MQREFSRSFDELAEIVSFTEKFFEQHGIDKSKRNVVDLCVEELFVNMVTYHTETKANILLEMSPHENGVEVSLTDYDVDCFDPQNIEPADVNAPLDQRVPGGLGVFLVLKMVDDIKYQYRDRTSKITFVAGRK